MRHFGPISGNHPKLENPTERADSNLPIHGVWLTKTSVWTAAKLLLQFEISSVTSVVNGYSNAN